MATVATNVEFLEGKKKKKFHLKVGFQLLKCRDLLNTFHFTIFFSLEIPLSLLALSPLNLVATNLTTIQHLEPPSPTKMAWVEQHAMKTGSLLAMSLCQKPKGIAQSAHQGTHMCFEQRGSPSSLPALSCGLGSYC